ncbi:hypothetical protein [Chryseobacterium sp. MMS23-Vi53]|uniref:hypothetical protein n=1 Tax=Chryseobacterium sp. MMS23-Vi53 TaxID=3386644 RepID=UPI0039E89451
MGVTKDMINAKNILLFLVLLEHLLCFYFNNIINKGNLLDSVEYYTRGLEVNLSKDLPYLLVPGRGILLVTSLLVNIFSNFLILSLFFSFVSFIPYYDIIRKYFEKINNENNVFLKFTFLFLLFIPSAHIWLTGIFKEALIFPLMYFLLLSLVKNRDKFLKADILFYSFLIFLLRPYLICHILLAYFITNFKYLNKKIILIVSILFMFFSLMFFKVTSSFVDISNLSKLMSEINRFSQAQGNSFIDVEKTSYLQRLIYMLFRPLFFDVSTKSQYLYSFENAILIIWFLVFLYNIIIKKIKANFLFLNIYFILSLLVWLFIGIYIYNYGLASRMKVMIVPFMMIGVIISIKQQLGEKNS